MHKYLYLFWLLFYINCRDSSYFGCRKLSCIQHWQQFLCIQNLQFVWHAFIVCYYNNCGTLKYFVCRNKICIQYLHQFSQNKLRNLISNKIKSFALCQSVPMCTWNMLMTFHRTSNVVFVFRKTLRHAAAHINNVTRFLSAKL